MKKIGQLIQSVKGRHAGQRRKTRAQSLVEFAITLPMLILLFAGLVELGFALNFYLSLLDATREAARYASNWDPFMDDGAGHEIDDMNFYSQAAALTVINLDPQVKTPEYQGRRIILDPSEDDVLVTVFTWSGGSVLRYPASGTFSLYHNEPSRFTNEMIASRFLSGSPNAGLVLVEVHYHYNQRLAIPFFTDYVPEIFMRAYTIMPLSAIR
jgi:hypothetical protein